MSPWKLSRRIDESQGAGELRPSPSPAALAFASRITEEEFRDVYRFAALIDGVAQQARDNERARIFTMSFGELMREFWKGRTLGRRE